MLVSDTRAGRASEIGERQPRSSSATKNKQDSRECEGWDGFARSHSHWCISRDDAAVMLVPGIECKTENLRRGIRRLRLF
eukprot:4375142-Pleurochrysis_carterae.AAC.1